MEAVNDLAHPEEADTLQTLGDQWLGRRVKALLADASGHKQRHPTLHAVTAGDPIPGPAAGLIKGGVSAPSWRSGAGPLRSCAASA